jgi:uncharacterized Zn finger protein (UPF0148 family)
MGTQTGVGPRIVVKPTTFLCPYCQKEIDLQEVLAAAPPRELAHAMRSRRKIESSLSTEQARTMGKKSGEARRRKT